MLNIIYGEIEDKKYIFDPDAFFDNTYEDEWIVDELSVRMIKDVDRSDVVGPHLIESPFLGPISVEKLSGGVKTLILVNQDKAHIFNASACGDEIEVRVVNAGFIAHSSRELDYEVYKNRLL